MIQLLPRKFLLPLLLSPLPHLVTHPCPSHNQYLLHQHQQPLTYHHPHPSHQVIYHLIFLLLSAIGIAIPLPPSARVFSDRCARGKGASQRPPSSRARAGCRPELLNWRGSGTDLSTSRPMQVNLRERHTIAPFSLPLQDSAWAAEKCIAPRARRRRERLIKGGREGRR